MMYKFTKIIKRFFLPVSLILVITLSRLIPHPYNFTPVIAAGIFSGFYIRQFFLVFFVIILSMFVGDLYLGFHNTMFFTYIALIVPVALGIMIKRFRFSEILVSGLISSVCFFLVTNFGAWITLNMYEKNLDGLFASYVLAIPFFHNTLISTFLYLILFKLLFDYLLSKEKIIKI